MADICLGCDAVPVAAAAFQQGADLGVEIGAHGAIIAKFYDERKQHIASPGPQTYEVDRKPINDVVAEALRFFMGGRWTNVGLAKAAGVAEGTIRNVLNPDKREPGKSGKEPPVKVTELAKIAAAIGVEVADLVTDATQEEREQLHRKRAAEHYMRTGNLPEWAPASAAETLPADPSRKQARAA